MGLNNSRRDPAPEVNLSHLVQQQQGMLLKVLQQQETLQENQKQCVERLDVLEKTLSDVQLRHNKESGSKQQHERSRVPKGLGVSYA